MTLINNLDYVVLDLIESSSRFWKSQPLNLGGLAGEGGGLGGPPGGFIGWLPQTRVAYDETEAATLFTPASGMSLLDNLNHVRYRIQTLESGVMVVDEYDGSPSVSNVWHITFSGGVEVMELEPGHVLINIIGTGSGGAGVPGGNSLEIQYNNAGAFGGADLEYDVIGSTSRGIRSKGSWGDNHGRSIHIVGAIGSGIEGQGGAATVAGGNTTGGGAGGGASVSGGTSASGWGGGVIITGGYGPGGEGGKIELIPGVGSGVPIYPDESRELDGFVSINNPGDFIQARFRTRYLDTHQDYYFPNESGTFVLDAPENGNIYGRQDGAWVIVSGGAGPGSGVALTVEEYDGSPSVSNVDKIIFSGLMVTDLGSGDVLVSHSESATSDGVSTHHTYFPISGGEIADVGSYYYMNKYVGGDLVHGIGTLTGGEQFIAGYVTHISRPGSYILGEGSHRFYVRARQTTGTKTIRLKCKLYKRSSGGTETLLLTSDETGDLTSSYAMYKMTMTGGPFNLDVTDRLVLKVYGTPYGAGTDPNGNLSYGNVDGFSRLELSSATEQRISGKFLIYDQTLTGTSATINVFPPTTLPTIGKDLHIRIIARTNRASASAEGILLEINDDTTAANYYIYLMWHNHDLATGNLSPVNNRTFAFATATTAPSGDFSTYDLVIYDYNATDKRKSLQSRGGQRVGTAAGNVFIYDAWGEWLSTSAITKVEFTGVNSGSFIAGTRVTAWLEG